MLTFAQAVPFAFGALFPFLNPLDSAVMFLALTMSFTPETRHALAARVGVNTFVLLGSVLLTGSWVLRFFGLSVPVVQIGGGAVVAWLGWTMLNRTGTANPSTLPAEKDAGAMAFFPLTLPVTAGPGCIAVTLTVGAHELTDSVRTTLPGEVGALVGIALGATSVYVCYRYADRLLPWLGDAGREVIVRLAAFVNLCIGIQMIWHGVEGLLATLH